MFSPLVCGFASSVACYAERWAEDSGSSLQQQVLAAHGGVAHGVEPRVHPARCHELRVVPLLRDASPLQHHYAISVTDGGEPVCQ